MVTGVVTSTYTQAVAVGMIASAAANATCGRAKTTDKKSELASRIWCPAPLVCPAHPPSPFRLGPPVADQGPRPSSRGHLDGLAQRVRRRSYELLAAHPPAPHPPALHALRGRSSSLLWYSSAASRVAPSCTSHCQSSLILNARRNLSRVDLFNT